MACSPRLPRVRMLYPIYVTGEAVSHITLSLCRHMNNDLTGATLTSAGHLAQATTQVRMCEPPSWMFRLLYRLGGDVRRCAERHYWRKLRPGDIADLWPTCSLELYRRLKEHGWLVVKEMINCHQAPTKRLLDREFAREGLTPTHDITAATIAQERAELALADAIVAPSPKVVESLLNEGVDGAKILPSSFGWDPQRVPADLWLKPHRPGEPVVLFIGRGCLRKGIHLLLRAWEKLDRRARLLIAGQIDPQISERFAGLLARPDVQCLGYRRDISAVLAQADVFAFPSLEEGGPQVSYEALAVGLPALVSPMGAGAVVRDGVEGLVLAPHDLDDWVAALRRLIDDADLRHTLGQAGVARAREFTWARVAQGRSRQLIALPAARSPDPAQERVPSQLAPLR